MTVLIERFSGDCDAGESYDDYQNNFLKKVQQMMTMMNGESIRTSNVQNNICIFYEIKEWL